MALTTEVKRSRDPQDTRSNFSQLFFAYESPFFNFPHQLRPRTLLLLLALKFSGDTISLYLSLGSYLIQFTTVWWQLQCPRGLGLEISVKVHLIERSKQHFSFTLFPELLLLRNCRAI